MSTYRSESAEILAAKARVETAKKFVQYTTANKKKATEALRDARSALQAARTELDDAETCHEAIERKWDEIEMVMETEMSDSDWEDSLSDAEESTDRTMKRAATSRAGERLKKKSRKSTGGKPIRMFLISKVPAIGVSGCGKEEANGTYMRDGEMNGYPKFSRAGELYGEDGKFAIQRNASNLWTIVFQLFDHDLEFELYATKKTDWLQNNPIQNEWELCGHGKLPLPDLTRLKNIA